MTKYIQILKLKLSFYYGHNFGFSRFVTNSKNHVHQNWSIFHSLHHYLGSIIKSNWLHSAIKYLFYDIPAYKSNLLLCDISARNSLNHNYLFWYIIYSRMNLKCMLCLPKIFCYHPYWLQYSDMKRMVKEQLNLHIPVLCVGRKYFIICKI